MLGPVSSVVTGGQWSGSSAWDRTWDVLEATNLERKVRDPAEVVRVWCASRILLRVRKLVLKWRMLPSRVGHVDTGTRSSACIWGYAALIKWQASNMSIGVGKVMTIG